MRRLLLVRRPTEAYRVRSYTRRAVTRPHGRFAGWTGPRTGRGCAAAARPERLERLLDTLPGVGPTVAQRLAQARPEHGRRPARPPAAPLRGSARERRIVDSSASEEAVDRGRRRGRVRARPRAAAARSSGGGRATRAATIPAIWFNQPWLDDKLAARHAVRLRGQLRRGTGSRSSLRPRRGAARRRTSRPSIPRARRCTPQRMRALVARGARARARDVPDPLPADAASAARLPLTRRRAARAPPAALARGGGGGAAAARASTSCSLLQLGLARRTRERERRSRRRSASPASCSRAIASAAVHADRAPGARRSPRSTRDLARAVPMQRLLQGDVGSGKTVVALYALLRAVERGYQGALMAPTETLAEQHFLTLEALCRSSACTCGLLTSSVGKRARDAAAGAAIVVGTHALIQEGVDLANLAVAVVDEQHRFGVEQRSALAGRSPHVLHMTATPIPRTLALTVYGDLPVTEIAKPPADAQADRDALGDRGARSEAYRRLRAAPRRTGRQAYVVCPLIEESETSRARAAEAEAERLQRAELRDFRVGCMHGRLKPADRRELMARFKAARARRARRDDGDRGRRRRPERDDHDRPGGRPLRPRAAPPAARPRRARGGAVVLPAGLAAEGGADRHRARAGCRRSSTRPTASSSPRSTSSCAARASCSARASRGSPICASRKLRADRPLLERARAAAAGADRRATARSTTSSTAASRRTGSPALAD